MVSWAIAWDKEMKNYITQDVILFKVCLKSSKKLEKFTTGREHWHSDTTVWDTEKEKK